MRAEPYVVDTNVLISAALLAGSVPAVLMQHLLVRGRLVFSPATFDELQTRLWRPKFDRDVSIDDRRAWLNDLAAVADWVETVEPRPDGARFSRDPDDDKFIHLALAARAVAIVSGDDDLLQLQQVEGVAMLSPAQALRRFGSL